MFPNPEALPPTMLYDLARRLARLLLTVFYRRIHVADVGRLPAEGPLLLVANHHNALVDPLLLLATVPRRLVPVAKAPLFAHPVMGPLLRAIGAIPVERRQDATPSTRTDPGRNASMFARAGAVLGEGGAILIFPEGVSQPEPVIMPLRTGAARIFIDGAARGAPLALVPVGLTYDDPATFRVGEALVQVGPAIDARDIDAIASRDPIRAVRELTARIAAALRALIVESRDAESLELVRLAEALRDQELEAPPDDLADRAAWRRRALGALTEEDDAGLGEALREGLRDYARDLARRRLAVGDLARDYPAGAVVRFVLREGWALLVGLPAALWGMLTHALPYQLTALATRAIGPEPDVEATLKLGIGAAFYPLCWLAEGWLVWRFGGRTPLAVFCLGLVPAGLIALTWQERLGYVKGRARGFFQFLADRGRHGDLMARRRALVTELEALMAARPDGR